MEDSTPKDLVEIILATVRKFPYVQEACIVFEQVLSREDDKSFLIKYFLGEENYNIKITLFDSVNVNVYRILFKYAFDLLQEIYILHVQERKAAAMAAKAFESEALKTVFLSHVSHELRTPLNAINGFAQILSLRYKDNEQLQGYVKHITDSTAKLLQHIDKIINLSKAETGSVSLSKRFLRIKDLLDKTISILTPQISEKSVRIIRLFDDDEKIYADEKLIEDVFINIIGNALKFVEDRGVIEVGTSIKDGRKLLFFRDNGPGIQESKLRMIFEPYAQAKDHHKKTGSGLGLAICKTIINRHNGSIWAESKVGEGATFYIHLPDAE